MADKPHSTWPPRLAFLTAKDREDRQRGRGETDAKGRERRDRTVRAQRIVEG
jgi:hypothetical protein